MEFEIEIKKEFVLGKPTAYIPQVRKTADLIERTKKNAAECVEDVFYAHEWIVKKEGEWAKTTWTQYCKEIGVHHRQPYRWFNKYGLEYTRTSRRDLVTDVTKPKALPKGTEPEIIPDIETIIDGVKELKIAQKDLKELVDTIADNVEGPTASAVLFHASRMYAKSNRLNFESPKKIEDSKVIKMVNSFHSFLDKLDAVRAAGIESMTKYDQETMDQEFKLMVPRALRLFDWMGIDLQRLVTNYVNRIKEVSHVQQNTQRLVGD